MGGLDEYGKSQIERKLKAAQSPEEALHWPNVLRTMSKDASLNSRYSRALDEAHIRDKLREFSDGDSESRDDSESDDGY
jgi:hypothetical protein